MRWLFWILVSNFCLGGAIAEDFIAHQNQFFLNEAQRAFMEKQRDRYLRDKNVVVEDFVMTPELEQAAPKKKPVKKRHPLPAKLEVSSIIILPSGEKKIRLNGKFVEKGIRNVKIVPQATTSDQASFQLNGQNLEISVGQSYLTRQKKLESSYKLQQTAKNPLLEKSIQQKTVLATNKAKQDKTSPLEQLKQMQNQLDALTKNQLPKK